MGTKRRIHGVVGTLVSASLSFSAAASAQTHVHTCPDMPNVRVEWSESPLFGTRSYRLDAVRARDGSTSGAGWQLHHRPVADWPYNHLQPDVIVTGGSIRGYTIWDSLIPIVDVPYLGAKYAVTALTSPDGECVFSPLTGGSRTYSENIIGPRVAVVGDSLVAKSELCPELQPTAPDYCAMPIGKRLRLSGQRTWIISGPAQTFYSWLDVVRERALTRPDTFVLAFGTNEARLLPRVPAEQRELQRWAVVRAAYTAIETIRAHNPDTCLVLVTVAAKSSESPEVSREIGRVNTLLKAIAADPAVGNVVIADFAAAVERECPRWQSTPNQTCPLFNSDHVHLTGRGDDVRDPLIVDAVLQCAAR
ncbi:MAG TPA: SGNH/GDSL hydrolase family protein [Polyangiaceae bacterium]|nr:SGNH/GDSL hydrolase family protein [Polyangiaceae bacterium]